MEVDLQCTLASDPDVECDNIQGVERPECQEGAPTRLCFRYTGEQCASGSTVTADRLLECEDTDGGPSSTASLLISSDADGGGVVMVNLVVQVDNEICVTNDGSALPDRLYMFFNEPSTGDRRQRVVVDTTCSGSGLTLQDSFGALDLVSYVNPRGEYDCFVDVEYKYVVTNLGPVTFGMTELDRVLNGESRNLISGVDSSELDLDVGEMTMFTEIIEIALCVESSYENDVSVTAQGSDGKICSDTDSNDFSVRP